MTRKNNARKKDARARQAATGEPYAEALRQVSDTPASTSRKRVDWAMPRFTPTTARARQVVDQVKRLGVLPAWCLVLPDGTDEMWDPSVYEWPTSREWRTEHPEWRRIVKLGERPLWRVQRPQDVARFAEQDRRVAELERAAASAGHPLPDPHTREGREARRPAIMDVPLPKEVYDVFREAATTDAAARALTARLREEPRDLDAWEARASLDLERAQELDEDGEDEEVWLPKIRSAARLYETALCVLTLSLPDPFRGVLDWGFTENRAVIRLFYGLATCRITLGQDDRARELFLASLWLNPVDNQGARFELDYLDHPEQYSDDSEDDDYEVEDDFDDD